MRTWLTSADFGSEAAVLMFIGCSSGPPGHPTAGPPEFWLLLFFFVIKVWPL